MVWRLCWACVQCERAQLILEAIFSDQEVVGALSAGKPMMDTVGQPPSSLRQTLNDGLYGHLRSNYYTYAEAIRHEITAIRRVQDLQGRALVLAGIGFAAALVGVSNFLSTLAYHEYEEHYL